MSIPADDAADRYSGDGTTVAFSYHFAIADQGQIVVMYDEFILTLGTHYLVQGVGDTDGGTVNFFTAPSAGVTVSLLRRESNSQETGYLSNEAYNALKIGRDLDHVIRVTQQLDEKIARAAKFPAHFLSSNPALPTPSPGKFLVWDNEGDLVNVSGEPVDSTQVIQFDVIGDGITNVTTEMQVAWNDAAEANRVLYMPAGTYMVGALAIPDNLRVLGDGKRSTIIKRINGSTANVFISGTSATGFSFQDIGFDGNKANQTNGAHNISLEGCGDFEFFRCAANNAYGPTYGAGLYHIEGVDLANNTQSKIIQCDFLSNERIGLAVQKVSNLLIDSNLFYSNLLAGLLTLHDFPPEIGVIKNLIISKNECLSNGVGIQVAGFLEVGSTALAPVYGHSVPPAVGVVINANQCILNTSYGIVYQSFGGLIADNYCDKNGFGTGYAGGILANASGATITGNVVVDSESYAIDAGWSIHSNISGNMILSTGKTSGLSIVCINLGRGCSAVGNNFYDNGTVAGGIHISAPGFDTDGNNLSANVLTNYTVISNNIIEAGHANVAGIIALRGHDGLIMQGNSSLLCTTAFNVQGGQGTTMHVRERDNIDWNLGVQPTIASATIMVIPDVGDSFVITGTTTIENIRTTSSHALHEQVRFVQITNNGTGYTSAPTVSFSGGGGSGAAGTARITGDGLVIGIEMTNNGSGYTSAPTVGFSGGGGSAAAGTAILGCDNFHGRDITLLFSDSLTVTDGGNLGLNGSLSAGNGTILCLHGSVGTWYEKSRSVN